MSSAQVLRRLEKDMNRTTILVPALLLVLCPAVAQRTTDHGTGEGNAQAPTQTGQPSAEMSLLHPRIGRWEATIRTEPSEGLPNGGVDKGLMTIRKGPGGFSIVQEFQSKGVSGDLLGESYTWWDKAKGTYRSVWCDNMQGCTEFATVLNGNSWIVELDGEANGKRVHTTIRATMSDDHNTIHEEFLNSYDGGPAKRETVSVYKRVRAER
jgi:hypothetical protein